MEKMYEISIHPQGYWEKSGKPIYSNVVSVKVFNNLMYVLTNTELTSLGGK